MLPHGPIRRRVGTYFVGEVRNSAKPAILIPFVTTENITHATGLISMNFLSVSEGYGSESG